ncbi:MAG: hypothetical protein CMD35_05910 [Flavobacteriales bacterium]|nr:hypothetical protein [Flavobacteriales bacterium]
MSQLTIEKDIEFIKNQVNYLDTFQQKNFDALKDLKSISSWKGLLKDELIYIDIDRWLKSYSSLKNHLSEKEVIDEELKARLSELPHLNFEKPLSTKEFLKSKGAFSRFLYVILPFFRVNLNKNRVKEIEKQLVNYKQWGGQLRKLSFQIERVYTDGI